MVQKYGSQVNPEFGLSADEACPFLCSVKMKMVEYPPVHPLVPEEFCEGVASENHEKMMTDCVEYGNELTRWGVPVDQSCSKACSVEMPPRFLPSKR